MGTLEGAENEYDELNKKKLVRFRLNHFWYLLHLVCYHLLQIILILFLCFIFILVYFI